MESCEKQFEFLQSKIVDSLDAFMPFREKKVCTTEKPWITDTFKQLIAKRQRAFKDGNQQLYKSLRNKVNRLNKALRGTYYKSKIEEMKSSNNRMWWKCVKQLTGSNTSGGHELESLVNKLTNGDETKLANDINSFFQSVSIVTCLNQTPVFSPQTLTMNMYLISI